MLENIDKILYISMVLYISTMGIILFVRPTLIYDHQINKFKSFGTKTDETLLALPVIGVTLCISIYLLIMIYVFIVSKLQ